MAASHPIVGQNLSHYRILEQIGAGGMGVVYRAYDEHLERDVALKVLPPGALANENARKRFRKEALALAKLNHPNIATIHEFDTQSGIDFLVMEYVDGATLNEKLNKGALSEREVLALGEPILKTLEDAHEQGIVHRDLKPGNIMITAKGQVKLLDFGLAKLLRSSDTAATESITEIDRVAGTLPYMAPEQLRGGVPDYRSDIYSAGAVLYEMATARRPFPQIHGPQLIDAILHEAPPPPSTLGPVSRALENIILKALDKEPGRRYQSARELLIDLQRLLSPAAALAARHRPRTQWAIAVVVLATLFITVVLGIRHRSRHPAALSPQDWVLVGDIDNRASDPVFDLTIHELLVTGLEQSQYFNVFPPSRIAEILRRMRRSNSVHIDEATGREICLREGLQALVTGSISRMGSSYVVVVRAVRPSGEKLVSIEKVATSVEEVPRALDAMAKSLRTILGESRGLVEKTSLPLAQVTSSSLEAVQYFSIGKQRLYAGSPQQAISLLDKALELDGEFAMAHEYLGVAYQHLGDPVRARKHLYDATRLLEQVSEGEKRKILGDYFLLIRDYDRAIAEFQVLAQLHPQDDAAHLNIGQCYLAKFDFAQALAETKEAVRLNPQPSPLTNLADIYLLKGEVDRGMAVAEEILRDNPTEQRALYDLGRAYIAKRQLEQARRVFEGLAHGGGEMESDARSALADLALAGGRFREARAQLETAIILDSQKGISYKTGTKKLQLAAMYLEQGSREQFTKAMAGIEKGENEPLLLLLTGTLYARAHRTERAGEMLTLLERQASRDQAPVLNSFVQLLHAEIAQAQRDPNSAVTASEAAVRYDNSTIAHETLGHAYRAAGRSWDAIRELEDVLSRSNERIESYDRPAFHHVVELHYTLGLLYHQVGKTDRAHDHLKEFLNYWSSPDSEVEIYKDARRRLGTTNGARAPLRGKPTPAT
jgi:serine/threonine protein kinase/tetratricopeptide (TPR) repeat protein